MEREFFASAQTKIVVKLLKLWELTFKIIFTSFSSTTFQFTA